MASFPGSDEADLLRSSLPMCHVSFRTLRQRFIPKRRKKKFMSMCSSIQVETWLETAYVPLYTDCDVTYAGTVRTDRKDLPSKLLTQGFKSRKVEHPSPQDGWWLISWCSHDSMTPTTSVMTLWGNQNSLTSADPLSYTTTIMIPGRPGKLSVSLAYQIWSCMDYTPTPSLPISTRSKG